MSDSSPGTRTNQDLIGPFKRPLRSDWAFYVFLAALAIDLAVRVPQTLTGVDDQAAAWFRVLVGIPFDLLGLLVIFSLVVGVPRGFRLGLRAGRTRAETTQR